MRITDEKHRSDVRMGAARMRITDALIADPELTTIERVQVLSELLVSWNRYSLRDELHPERLEDETIEWYEQYLAKAKAGQAERKAEEAEMEDED